jgi:integrase
MVAGVATAINGKGKCILPSAPLVAKTRRYLSSPETADRCTAATATLQSGADPAFRKGNTKKEAEYRLAELVHGVDTGDFVKPSKVTFAQFLERWLCDYAWPNLAPRTAEGYEHIIRRHLMPSLGSILLTQLKPEHLQRYYSQKLESGRLDGKGKLTQRTVRHHHVTLHDALQTAMKWGLLSRNPADGVESPRFQRPEMHTLDEDDVRAFLEAARSTPYHALFYLALFTGMRRSELPALRWDDIDLDLCHASVTRTLHHLRDGAIVFRAPKTAKGRRTVALPPSVALVLKEHRAEQEVIRSLLGTPLKDRDLVFSRPDGRPLLPDTVTHAWIKLAHRAGLKGIRLHDARHSHASLMLKQGIHPKIVQERLGHASIQITLDTYSHVSPGLQEAAAVRFDEGLASRHEKEVMERIG